MREILDDIQTEFGLPETVVVVLLVLLLLAAIKGGIELVLAVGRFLFKLVRRVVVGRAGPEGDDDRRKIRQLVAKDQIWVLDTADRSNGWDDSEYAELDAEVEISRPRRTFFGLWQFFPFRNQTRRASSLTSSLVSLGLENTRRRPWRRKRASDQRIVFVHGAPGSGKSVALRHAARRLAEQAAQDPMRRAIPLYVNLNRLSAPDGGIDRQAIRDYVLSSLSATDTEEALKDEFGRSLRDGLWLFLFDSFDEIPAILAASDDEDTVAEYATAIHAFLEANVNGCNAVIASRKFRAPPSSKWPILTIRPLDRGRQVALVTSALRRSADRKLLLKALPEAESISNLADNSMFLRLVCDYVADRHAIPQTRREVFDDHLRRQLEHVRSAIEKRGVSPEQLRRRVEELAFVMTGSSGGLAARRDELLFRRAELGFTADARLPQIMDILEELRIAKFNRRGIAPGDAPFEFRHRRVQEYLAASLILTEPSRLRADDLLFDPRWREIAVTLCQAEPKYAKPLVQRATNLLVAAASQVDAHGSADAEFAWPSSVRHVLGMLQDAFPRDSAALPIELRAAAGRVLLTAYESGRVNHRWWALEVAGPAVPDDLTTLVRAGFAARSDWLRDAAYQQVGRLTSVDDEIAAAVRRTLLSAVATKSLRRDRATHEAQLGRLLESRDALDGLRTAITAERINAAAHLGYAGLAIWAGYGSPAYLALNLVLAGSSYLAFYDTADLVARKPPRAPVGQRPSPREQLGAIVTGLREAWAGLQRARRQGLSHQTGAGGTLQSRPLKARVVWRIIARCVLGLFLATGFAIELYYMTWWSAIAGILLAGLLWPITALIAVERGEYLDRARRLVVPLTLARALWEWKDRILWTTVLVASGAVLAFATILWALFQIEIDSTTATWIYLIVVSAIALTVLLRVGLPALRDQLRDLFAFQRWQAERGLLVSQEEFIAVLAQQRTARGVLRIIADTRVQHLLAKAGDLTDLVLDLEDLATLPSAVLDDLAEATGLPDRCSWTHSWIRPAVKPQVRAIRKAGPDFVDELGRLLHQETDRPGAPTVAAAV